MPSPEIDERSDAELMSAIAELDEPALAVLYDRYRSFSHTIALRVLDDPGRAEDVVQDSFLTVWRRAGSYVATRGSVRTWLGTVVRNRAIDVVRGRREVSDEDESVLGALRDPAPAVDDQVATTLDGELVRAAVAQLPEAQRAAIGMAYFQGRSHTEIAELTGLPLGTVKSRVRLGMERLRGSLVASGIGA